MAFDHNKHWQGILAEYKSSSDRLEKLNNQLQEVFAQAQAHPRRPSLAHEALELAQEHHELFKKYSADRLCCIGAIAWLHREALVRYYRLGCPGGFGQPPEPRQVSPGFIPFAMTLMSGHDLCGYIDKIVEEERSCGIAS